MIIQELKRTNKDFFGYYPSKIRAKEMEIIRTKSRNRDYKLLTKLFFGLTIDQEMGCWITDDWTEYRSISIDGKTQKMHRISYHIMRRPIIEGKQICHYCDRKGCINPFHLFQGTALDNKNDYRLKKRRIVTVEKKVNPDGSITYVCHESPKIT